MNEPASWFTDCLVCGALYRGELHVCGEIPVRLKLTRLQAAKLRALSKHLDDPQLREAIESVGVSDLGYWKLQGSTGKKTLKWYND